MCKVKTKKVNKKTAKSTGKKMQCHFKAKKGKVNR